MLPFASVIIFTNLRLSGLLNFAKALLGSVYQRFMVFLASFEVIARLGLLEDHRIRNIALKFLSSDN